jgi:hypothetical protein
MTILRVERDEEGAAPCQVGFACELKVLAKATRVFYDDMVGPYGIYAKTAEAEKRW